MNNPETSSQDRLSVVQSAVTAGLEALQGLSNAEALKALKQICAVYNSHPVSNFAPQGQSSSSGRPTQSAPRRSGLSTRPKPENQAPEVKALKEKLRPVQERIRDASKAYPGGVLPRNHELIVDRDKIMAEIISAKSLFRPQGHRPEGEKVLSG